MGGVGQGGGAAAYGLAGRRSAGGEPLHWASLALYFFFVIIMNFIILPSLSVLLNCPYLNP